jgi:parvulin-like peptidyl-prolyl isomerase
MSESHGLVATEKSFSGIPQAELAEARLWRPLLRARLLAGASADTPLEEAEIQAAWEGFCRTHRMDPATSQPVPPEFSGCSPERLRAVVARELKIAKWKAARFAPGVSDHFEKRKPSMDRVVYSLLRVKEGGLARELWFRVKEGEATFAELAPAYASGNEVYTAGIIGPVALGAMHPSLAAVLRGARPGELLKPFAIAEWFLVARLEHFLPSVLDEATRSQMVEELCQQWVETKLNEQ